MKRFNLLSVVAVLVLAVTAFSCTTVRETGEYYEPGVASNRVYVDDPYRGTVILERDPYTGRYYEANTFGRTYGYPYGRGVYRNNGFYGRPDRYYGNGGYYRGNRGGNYGNRPAPSTPQQQPQNGEQREKVREEARKKVLGN
ncbi:MAG TPA: hypothetical protein VFR58_10100 [Flavisolibacter sp.]|nr:hypothetical protein [Flavisolibacter sp.]